MKPLPNIDDEAAMLLRGKRSALAAARNDAEASLRDAYTLLQSAEWDELETRLTTVNACVAQIGTINNLWHGIGGKQ